MQRLWRASACLILAVALSGCIPTAQTAPVAGATGQSTAAPVPSPETPPQQPEAEKPEDAQPAPRTIPASVVRVVDGDTAVFQLATGESEKVRFIGVDTPESTNKIEPFGKQASAYTRESLPTGTDVFLERGLEERDRYGRLLAYVWLEEPVAETDAEIRAKMFNAHLALNGYAQQMTIQPNSKYADFFRTYVAEARDANRGLWRDGAGSSEPEKPKAQAPTTPQTASGSASYIGNRNTMKFHFPTCSSVGEMNPANQVPLSSRDAAVKGGYVPCGRCRP